ncbi:8-oxo-dGTP diphosphatase [Flavimobilis soli]|uniref:8-oxo-dGTP diphosphatase n=1 Tax=Flavimobilis soli TaxID=442709 RepID=A0A2A9EG34_9MICO|nr:NUDIX hydrolase [Flavimobilis soli]PFG37212.1 8-oxo-dGTP diphosphatase [Flavimobilis soli]
MSRAPERASRASGSSLADTGESRRRHAIEAAGALVWRVHDGALQVLLIHRPRYGDWSWPKGKLDPGETLRECAVREVAEETGVQVVLGVPLPMLRYKTPEGRFKRVHYWAARPATPEDAPAVRARTPVPPVDPGEIDDLVWLDVADARRRLSRRADREPLDALVKAHAKDRLDTRALVVARHARARKRAAWAGTEEDRPLTPAGYLQAATLVPILAAYGAVSITTSHWLRCADTMVPYARESGLTSLQTVELTEATHESSPGTVAEVVERMLTDPHGSVLCTHRPVLPTVMAALAAHSRRSVRAELPSQDPYLKPGELLVAHVAQRPGGPRVVAVEWSRSHLHQAILTKRAGVA